MRRPTAHVVAVDEEIPANGEMALFDGHPPGVLGHERTGLDLAVVGDDDGGGVAAQAGDDELADVPG